MISSSLLVVIGAWCGVIMKPASKYHLMVGILPSPTKKCVIYFTTFTEKCSLYSHSTPPRLCLEHSAVFGLPYIWWWLPNRSISSPLCTIILSPYIINVIYRKCINFRCMTYINTINGSPNVAWLLCNCGRHEVFGFAPAREKRREVKACASNEPQSEDEKRERQGSQRGSDVGRTSLERQPRVVLSRWCSQTMSTWD